MKITQTNAGRLTMPHWKMMLRLKVIVRTSQKTLQIAQAEETVSILMLKRDITTFAIDPESTKQDGDPPELIQAR